MYSYLKIAKQGELAEGENPMHTIRIGAEEYPALEEKRQGYLAAGWEQAEESEWEGADEEVVEVVAATEEAIAETAEETPVAAEEAQV